MVKIDFEMPSNCYDCCFVGFKEKDGKRTFACDILRAQGKDTGSVEEIFQTTGFGKPDNCPLIAVKGDKDERTGSN